MVPSVSTSVIPALPAAPQNQKSLTSILSDFKPVNPQESSQAALEVREAKKSYRSHPALADVSFQLQRGEHLALLGPNGAGKTTLLRCLSGRVKPDAGTFQLLGKPLDSTNRNLLGIVPQEIALYPRLTALQNLTAFARLYGVQKREIPDRVKWALEWTGLESRANHQAKTFSGGMKRRLNIACGILHSPQVILLDEPTAGVDPQSRARIFEMLEHLREDGSSLLLTTHQFSDVETYCDRIVIMDHGRVVTAGTKGELIERTVGRRRQLRVKVDRTPPQPIAGFDWNPRGEFLEAEIDDVVEDLPRLLRRLSIFGYEVRDVDVQAPSLQNVFLKLTGRELRE